MAYLLAATKHYYPERNKPLLGIVLHVTAGLEDLDLQGVDHSADSTIKYGQTTSRQVSWHGISDSDSYHYCLPPEYTAWHVKGYNSPTYGWEICNLDAKWGTKPKAWVDATIRQAAAGLLPIVEKFDLPIKLATKAEVDAAIAANRKFGFTYHMWLDPARRRDPSDDFPWSDFAKLLGGSSSPTKPPAISGYKPGARTVRKGSVGEDVKYVQVRVGVKDDGIFGPITEAAVRRYQAKHGLLVDGIVGPKTWAVLLGKEPASTARPVLRRGSTGDWVKRAQRILGVKDDGIFGPITEAATKTFQRRHGLDPDGVIGPLTWGRML